MKIGIVVHGSLNGLVMKIIWAKSSKMAHQPIKDGGPDHSVSTLSFLKKIRLSIKV